MVQREGGPGESWRNETGTGGRSQGGEAEGHSEELHPETSRFQSRGVPRSKVNLAGPKYLWTVGIPEQPLYSGKWTLKGAEEGR